MKKLLLLSLLLIAIAPGRGDSQQTGPQELIKKGDLLQLDRCITLALKHHPSRISAQNIVHAQESRVGQARSNYYPKIDWFGGYTEVSSAAAAVGGASASRGSTGGRSIAGYSSAATLRQTLYDFGKTTSGVKVENLNLDSSRADLQDVSDQIIFNVKQGYYSLLQTQRNAEVALEVVKQFEQHLEQAEAFYKAGTRPKIDVTKAEVDVSAARLNLITAKNALKVAQVQLNNAMGIPDAPDYTIEDTLFFQKYAIVLEKAVAEAYTNRSDLKSLTARKDATEESITLAKKDYYPTLSGDASYNWVGRGFPLEDGWTAGLTLTFPLFSGFSTTYQVEESKANFHALDAAEEALKQTILLENQRAYLSLQEAEERIYTAELSQKQAWENLELANGRYASGVGSPLEVTDAEVAYSDAKTSYITALYDYKVAQASLERAMGIR